MIIDINETLERMRISGEEELVLRLHPDECVEIYNQMRRLKRQNSIDETLLMFFGFIVLFNIITLIGIL